MPDNPTRTRPFLPLALSVEGRKCLVIGGGQVGTRKVLNLLRAEADVTVVAPAVSPELSSLIEAGQVTWIAGPFKEEHLPNAFLVVAATDDPVVNTAVVRSATERGVLICDASSAERSQVIFGALLQRNHVTVAVFSNGQDPAASRQTRDQIARLIE